MQSSYVIDEYIETSNIHTIAITVETMCDSQVIVITNIKILNRSQSCKEHIKNASDSTCLQIGYAVTN